MFENGESLTIQSDLRARAPSADHIVALRIAPNRILTFVAFFSLVLTAWIGSMAALTFLISSFILWVRHPAQAVREVLLYWPFFLIPLWCLLTLLWSREPLITMRYGMQLGFTCLVAVAIAARLSPRDFLWGLFGVHAIAAALSVAMPNAVGEAGAWLGIFGSKNQFSFTMSNLVLMSLALVLDGRVSTLRKIPAFGGLLVGFFLLLMGRSAGALLTTTLAINVALVVVGLRLFPIKARLLLVVLILMGTGAIGLVAWGFRAELQQALLDATGKDVTLTGRTELWAAAFHEISLNPLVGQGFQAVWVPGNPVAEAMWARFLIESRSGFNFHNTWISNAVEIGLIGVGIQALVFVTTLLLVWRWVLLSPSATALYMTMFMTQLTMLSGVEVVLYGQFSLNTIIAAAALIYGLRFRAESRQPRAAHGLPQST